LALTGAGGSGATPRAHRRAGVATQGEQRQEIRRPAIPDPFNDGDGYVHLKKDYHIPAARQGAAGGWLNFERRT